MARWTPDFFAFAGAPRLDHHRQRHGKGPGDRTCSKRVIDQAVNQDRSGGDTARKRERITFDTTHQSGGNQAEPDEESAEQQHRRKASLNQQLEVIVMSMINGY